MEKCVSHSLISSFADDTRLLRVITCTDDTDLLQQDLFSVSVWSEENCMVFHEKKFELLCHLSNKGNPLHELPFTSELYNYTTSNGVVISPSTSIKDLGVISALTFPGSATSAAWLVMQLRCRPGHLASSKTVLRLLCSHSTSQWSVVV